ncbi:MAG: ATP-grasp domain-containing protein [Nocardiopsaceae bacterium]|nr:ATP-grasp domain-containing protein [Nocardiopsaceae bacterium]
MHIAFVDSNAAGLEAIGRAKDEGHLVSYVESLKTYYPRTAANQRLTERADWIRRDVATTDAAAVTEVLAECHAWHPIDFVVTTFELAAEAVALGAKALGLRCTSPDGVLTARRKDLTRAALRDAGLATPSYAVARDAGEAVATADSIGYPVVIKPPSGTDSKLTFVARDQADVRAGCAATLSGPDAMPSLWQGLFRRGLLVEEHLAGPLVSVEIGMRDSRGHVFCISGRTRARDDEVVEIGPHIPAELTAGQARDCEAYAESACRAVGLDVGVFHLEMIVTSRGPVLVEANPRIMGGIMPTVYAHATGRNIYGEFLRLVSGAPMDAGPPSFDGCVTGRRFFAAGDGRLPESLDTRWLEAYPDELIRFDPPEDLGLCPPQPVRRGTVVGRVIVRGADYAATARTGAQMASRMEESLGIELMRGEYDS